MPDQKRWSGGQSLCVCERENVLLSVDIQAQLIPSVKYSIWLAFSINFTDYVPAPRLNLNQGFYKQLGGRKCIHTNVGHHTEPWLDTVSPSRNAALRY